MESGTLYQRALAREEELGFMGGISMLRVDFFFFFLISLLPVLLPHYHVVATGTKAV